jgi:SSS family solute:Na+ symporter
MIEIVLGVFLVYSAIMMIISQRLTKWITSSSDYLLAGREVSTWVNWFSIAAIGYAGTAITYGSLFAILFGFAGAVGWNILYSILGVSVYGVVFASMFRRSGAHTLQEFLEYRYDKRTRLVLSVAAVIAMLGVVGNNILSFAVTLGGYTSWPQYICVSIGFIIVMVYVYLAGIWGVSVADFIETLVAIVILPVMAIYLIVTFGGWSFISSNWPWGDPLVNGLRGSMPILSLIYPSMLTSAILYTIGLVWGNQAYFIRVASSRSEKTAKWSFIAAGLTLFVLDGVLLALPGLYNIAVNGPGILKKVSPEASFGYMSTLYPLWLSVICMVTALSSGMSTGGDYLIATVSTAIRDLYQRWFKPKATPKELLKPSRILLLVAGLIGWGLTLYPGGVLFLFAFACSWLAPAGVLLILGVISKKWVNSTGAFYGGLCGLIAGTLWTLSQFIPGMPNLVSTIAHIGVISTVSTLVPTLLISAVTKPRLHVASTANETENIKVTNEDLKVLKLIYFGYNHCAEIVDALGADLSSMVPIIERLELQGLIRKEGNYGSKMFSFYLTEEGKKALGKLSSQEIELAANNISPLDLKILDYVDKHGRVVAHELEKYTGHSVVECAASMTHLIRLEMLTERGILRRRVSISNKGKGVLEKLRSFLEE